MGLCDLFLVENFWFQVVSKVDSSLFICGGIPAGLPLATWGCRAYFGRYFVFCEWTSSVQVVGVCFLYQFCSAGCDLHLYRMA